MRAVNLMPGDDRAARAIRAAGTGGIVYVVLGGLAVMVALVGLWASSGNQISNRQATLDRVNVEARAAETRAAEAAPYETFATLAQARVSTVKSLSATRFDWAHSLRELSRVLPDDVWLTSLSGTSGASGAAPSTTANSAPAPTFEFVGCTDTQTKVAALMARLRAVDGVRDVDLKTSEKPDAAGDKDCPANSMSDPKFTIVIAFKAPGAAKDAVDATGQVVTDAPAAPATSAAAPAAATAAAPAAATTPAPSAPTSTPSNPATSER
ncbi:MAG: PilN domain-containing protein [Solirubrobacteraceae bacterium]